MDRFIKDMESATRHPGHEAATVDVETEEGSSSDMDFGNMQILFTMNYFVYLFFCMKCVIFIYCISSFCLSKWISRNRQMN